MKATATSGVAEVVSGSLNAPYPVVPPTHLYNFMAALGSGR